MSSPRYTCRASAEITVIGARAPSAAATAVLPTPVGPTSTGTRGRSGSPKPPLQLVLRQLHDGRPAVHVVGRQGGAEDADDELPHLVRLEPLAGLDRGAAGEAGGEALQPVRPAAEAAAREIGHELLQAARRVEPRMRVGSGVNDDGAARERLDLVADAPQQRPAAAPPGSTAPRPAQGPPTPDASPPTPSGDAAASGPSAPRTASSTTRSTKNLSRKRTSSLVGWTLTSTASPGRSRNRMSVGRSPGAMVERYPASAARRMQA